MRYMDIYINCKYARNSSWIAPDDHHICLCIQLRFQLRGFSMKDLHIILC